MCGRTPIIDRVTIADCESFIESTFSRVAFERPYTESFNKDADDRFVWRSSFIPTSANDRWAGWTRHSIRKWRPAGTGR